MNPIKLKPRDEVECYMCGKTIKDYEARVIFPDVDKMEFACEECADKLDG